MIRPMQHTDRHALKNIWSICFHDTDSYIDFFFDSMEDVEGLVCEEQGEIISMIFLLNCSLQGLKGKYIFAAATLPNFRGRGHMTCLLNAAAQCCRSDTDFLCLVPSEHSLFDYYHKTGFTTFFYNMVQTFANKQTLLVVAKPLSFTDFAFLRSQTPSLVQWGKRELNYIYHENLYTGGKNVKLSSGYAILQEDGDQCEVLEWVSRYGDVEELFHLTPCSQIIVRNPPKDGELRPNGMIRILKPELADAFAQIKHPYLSLVLD